MIYFIGLIYNLKRKLINYYNALIDIFFTLVYKQTSKKHIRLHKFCFSCLKEIRKSKNQFLACFRLSNNYAKQIARGYGPTSRLYIGARSRTMRSDYGVYNHVVRVVRVVGSSRRVGRREQQSSDRCEQNNNCRVNYIAVFVHVEHLTEYSNDYINKNDSAFLKIIVNKVFLKQKEIVFFRFVFYLLQIINHIFSSKYLFGKTHCYFSLVNFNFKNLQRITL